jgi:hypothetical protein
MSVVVVEVAVGAKIPALSANISITKKLDRLFKTDSLSTNFSVIIRITDNLVVKKASVITDDFVEVAVGAEISTLSANISMHICGSIFFSSICICPIGASLLANIFITKKLKRNTDHIVAY